LRVREKKLTNSGSLRESVDKHSIYTMNIPLLPVKKHRRLPPLGRKLHQTPAMEAKEGVWNDQECFGLVLFQPGQGVLQLPVIPVLPVSVRDK
jgi:hypothetical protein